MNTLIILSIFSGLGAKIGLGVAGIASTFGIVKKWGLIVDKCAKFIAKWSNTIYLTIPIVSNFFLDIRNTSQKVDDAISDETGHPDINTLKEAIELGKKVKIDLDDMIVVFKPKK